MLPDSFRAGTTTETVFRAEYGLPLGRAIEKKQKQRGATKGATSRFNRFSRQGNRTNNSSLCPNKFPVAQVQKCNHIVWSKPAAFWLLASQPEPSSEPDQRAPEGTIAIDNQ